MGFRDSIRGFLKRFGDAEPVPRHEPTLEQKREITDEIRKQRFRGDMAGRQEYDDESAV